MSFLSMPGGFRLRYSDRGPGSGSGPGSASGPGSGSASGSGSDTGTVLLVHGWKGSHRLWDKVVVELMGARRVVSFDLRGMGESDKPACRYDFDEMAADVGGVIDALELEDVTLVGWSMGCTVGLSYMAGDGHGVSRLVLTNGPLRLTQTADFPHAMVASELTGYTEDMARRWPSSEYEFQRATLIEPDPPVVDLLYRIALQTPLDVALAIVRAQEQLDMRDTLDKLAIPVLAVYSEHDPYYPTSLADYIASHAADGQRVVLQHSAHAVPLEEPRAYAEAIERFIASRPRRAEG